VRTRPTAAVVTGGAGFVGTNLAARLAASGRDVYVLDNLSRTGVEENLRWLCETFGERIHVELADVTDETAFRRVLPHASNVFHLAAQVAVTTSLEEPLHDHAINVTGTLTLLEELRRLERPPTLLYTSTNKVYGALPDVRLARRADRWEPADPRLCHAGIGEERPLDFCTPYGCSKGAADQYVLDYAKSFGLRTVVFRMSCIYGPHQHGNEDQGWVAHFLRAAKAGRPITIYGDGAQVRDILFVDDLVEAMLLAVDGIEGITGQAFNIGGGPENTVSLLELIDLIELLEAAPVDVLADAERPGDQRWYVSDTRKFRAATGWRPRVGATEGIEALADWLASSRTLEPAAR
jgi:CDP-paratose 2-epimerase